MNETDSIGHPAREHIRSLGLFAFIFVRLFGMLRAVDAIPTTGSVAEAANKIRSRVTDIIQFSQILKGRDQQIAIDVGNVAVRMAHYFARAVPGSLRI